MTHQSRREMADYCDLCKRLVRDWETHRLSSEHQKRLIEVRDIPAEAKQAGEKHLGKED